MDFIIHNWLWFGVLVVVILFLAAINFVMAAKSSVRMDSESFMRHVGIHLALVGFWLCAIIPFCIGTVVAIIRYVQNQ